jgi:hypothetical protein
VVAAWIGVMALDVVVFFVGVVLTGRRSMLMLLPTYLGRCGEDLCCNLEISTRWPWVAAVIFSRKGGLSRRR